MKQQIYNAALYMRLSRDDELQGESGSIQTQRMLLRDYAREHNFRVVDEYIDDGWSGTNFDRPDFQRMIEDIEEGKINCVITKDLSRLGRNYILTGQYTEIYFPTKGVRYIAINDNVDTENGESELAPFLNILNEMHARQTSKKVKSAMRARQANGAHYCAYAPLGYIKDPERKGHLIPDEENRWIIEKIFQLASQGMGAAKINRILTEERIPTPAWVAYQRDGSFAHIFQDQPEGKRYDWTIAQLKNILKDETYIGNSVHNKQTTISFKNKKKIRKSQEEWFRVENTHAPLVEKEVFELVQSQIDARRRKQKDGTTQLFSGLVKCADCKWSMRFGTNHQNKTPYSHLSCSQYGQFGKRKCSAHYIRYDALYTLVLERLQKWIDLAKQDENTLYQMILQSGSKEREATKRKQAAELKKAEKRRSEIDALFAKMYEDWSSGRITEYNFNMLSAKYQSEQEELDKQLIVLKAEAEESKQSENDVQQWIELIRKYNDLSELTPELLNAFIERIYIHEAVKNADGTRTQKVDIHYRFIGNIG